MKKTNCYYPNGTELIWHHSRDGRKYRLDAVDQPVRIMLDLKHDPRFDVIPVNSVDDKVLFITHSPALINSYKSGNPFDLATSSGIEWQSGFYDWVINKVWATIFAVKNAVKEGKSLVITSGGHHAEFEHGRGFGPISNMIIAAKYLLNNNFLKKVAILDLDVHYANGTHSQVKGDPRILSCDIWRYRLTKWIYTSNRKNILHKKANNITDYFIVLDQMFKKIAVFKPDVLFLYNGLDPLENDRMGGIKGFDEKCLLNRNKLVAEFIHNHKLPITVFIGGGYINYNQNEIDVEASKNKLTKLFIESSAVALGL
ncbi:hypothetical protein KBD45_08635 [Candidatus Dojkabacteria bacterium]|nr:hypothetical protein [Candidatus Dojkabacteria bacterium]